MKRLLLCLPLCICMNVFAQTSKSAVDSLEKQYVRCLSEGKSNYNCALQYYSEMDSLLKTVYRELYDKVDNNRRQTLQISQSQWEEKRQVYFREIDLRVEKKRPQTLAGLDDDMIVTDNKATFLKTRVIELLGGRS